MTMHPKAGTGLSIKILKIFAPWRLFRAQVLLEKWAADNGLEILDYRWPLSPWPFLWTNTSGQMVLYIRSRDRQGRERSGWFRCGGIWWMDIVRLPAEVRWDRAARAS